VQAGDTQGRVLEVSDDGVTFGTSDGERTVGWGEVGRGTVQVEFRRNEEED
jgi:hypothetical protein